MNLFKKTLTVALVGTMSLSLIACDSSSSSNTAAESSSAPSASASAAADLLSSYKQDNTSLTFDNSAWNYDKDNNVYWQIGVKYSSKPETTDYETMAIYVPGEYMTAAANGDGTYTCTINKEGKVNGYTAETAPIVFPVNTAGYSAQKAATEYSYNGLSSYMKAGFIYVYAGLRGRDNGYDDSNNLTYSGGAPWGVTDLKAAVRYYRFNEDILPGSTDHIYTFGHSGGGAQSALMGASGDSELYYQYLESIGAAMYDTSGSYISDAIDGAMAWCPITSLDYADEAYEWNMGQYATTGTRADDTWTSALSDDLAEAYAAYLNELGLKDEQGTVLALEKSDNGIYTSGTYYDYLLSVIERSLNNFLSDTTFPYTKTSGGSMGDGGFAGGGAPGGEMPSGEAPSGDLPSGDAPSGDMPSGEAPSGGAPGGAGSSSEAESTTYQTAQDYIDSLNSDEKWVEYDAASNTAKITSIEAFVTHMKNASKDVGAFDDLNLKQAENNVFGNDESDSLHFDSVLADLLEKNQDKYAAFSDWDSSFISAYKTDLQAVDKFGSTIQSRMDMYNPMYYLTDYYDGYKTSKVASHWRIHTGIEQGDTALTVETNLALALKNYDGVKDVDFATVWGQGHTTAERTGNSTDNFIAWVNESVSE
ncbi:subtype A tannase [Paenibacillus pinistramenti]|uniref:subtype A tannase n=1 Tax=Paenibacillus pinistramenti TaxID=1768003 RepID=UPI001108CB74|nr:subtype A tannase [Paenibacillus pinistramenti]